MAISLNRDGDQALVEFDYSNATKNKSKKGEGYYYTFAVNGGDKLHVNRFGFKAIDANWPGKNGVLKIERLGEDAYDVESRSKGEEWPLELKQWNNNTRIYDDVPNWIMGQDPEDIDSQPAPQQQQSKPAQRQQSQQTASGAPPAASWEQLSGMMGHAVMLASQIWEHEGPSGVTGDVAGAVERMAVSIYIDARKMGLQAPGGADQSPAEKAVRQVAEALDGEQVDPSGAGLEDDDQLPF